MEVIYIVEPIISTSTNKLGSPQNSEKIVR